MNVLNENLLNVTPEIISSNFFVYVSTWDEFEEEIEDQEETIEKFKKIDFVSDLLSNMDVFTLTDRTHDLLCLLIEETFSVSIDLEFKASSKRLGCYFDIVDHSCSSTEELKGLVDKVFKFVVEWFEAKCFVSVGEKTNNI